MLDFLENHKSSFYNLPYETLVEHCVRNKEGKLSDRGALCINTGKFTGRSPQDRYIVRDAITDTTVDWGEINKGFSTSAFEKLEQELVTYLEDKTVYIQDGYACANESHRLNVRLYAEKPWSAHFFRNMFLRPKAGEKNIPNWEIICAPGFKANPTEHGTRQENFAIINFTKQRIIIGGTGYTGEIKKGIFSVLNFLLPEEQGVLPMHCSANEGKEGDIAIYFGLSGTGKTTLSADPERMLIGDDEHGWSDEGVFNFEGGCYAKCIDLNKNSEPDIFNAIKEGAILENIGFKEDEITPDYSDDSITQNTRVSYPIFHIDNIKTPSNGGIPKNIFFLTCDAFGVLPPISRLTVEQAMFHFISGYTAKVAGTETGITEPKATFSACFGAPFLPLHPTKYAEMLGEKMRKHNTKVWLVNTGWTGGPFGVGNRIKLSYTRSLIKAVLKGDLEYSDYFKTDIFNLYIPESCPGVPKEILNPKNTWESKEKYDLKAAHLAGLFNKNFKKYRNKVSEEINANTPRVVLVA